MCSKFTMLRKLFLLALATLFFSFNHSVVHSADTMDTSVVYKSQTEKNLVLEAAELHVRQMYDEAIKAYTKAIQLNPEHSTAYGARGLVYAEKGNYDQAIIDFDEAIKISHTDFQAHYGRALTYSKMNDFEKALIGFYRSLKLNPNWADAYYDIGLIYQIQGNINGALSNYSKAIELNPNLAVKSYISRGSIYNDLGDPNRAIADLNKAVIISPNEYTIYYNRAISYFYKKEYDKSWDDLHKVDELGASVSPILRQELIKASGKEE